MTLDLSPENLAFLVKVGQLPTEAVEVEVTPTEAKGLLFPSGVIVQTEGFGTYHE